MLKNLTRTLAVIIFGAGLLFAACSGGDGSESPTATIVEEATSVPDSEPTSAPAEATAPPEATAPAPELSLDALLNGTYLSGYTASGEYTMVDGGYDEDTGAPLGPLFIVLTADPVFGDLDGDGVDDAVFITVTNTGGTGRFHDVIAVLNDGGSPAPTAPVDIGDRTRIDELRIVDGTIEIDAVIHGPEDGGCCPSVPATLRFVVDGASLVPVE